MSLFLRVQASADDTNKPQRLFKGGLLPPVSDRYTWNEPLPPPPVRLFQEAGSSEGSGELLPEVQSNAKVYEKEHCEYLQMLKSGMQQHVSVSAS